MATAGTINPLPSLIRASAHDAANARMRAANRKKWTKGDLNAAVALQENLTRACYGREGDAPKSLMPFIRFSVAEELQREGLFTLNSNFDEVSIFIDEMLAS